MWKSCRIDSAQECGRKKSYEPETKQVAKQEETIRERDDGAHGTRGYGSFTSDAEDEEKEKSRLLSCAVASSEDHLCFCKNPSSLCRLPSRAAMVVAGQELASSLRIFLTYHLKKLRDTSHLRSFCHAVKRRCIVSFTGPAMCIPFGFPVEEDKTAAEEIGVYLIELGLHVRAPILLSHRRFGLHDLRMATSHFSEKNILGKGSSGCVYKGELASGGESIAVKVLNVRSKDARLSFATELEIMSCVCNHHIQPLLGYCVEDGNLFLVYTYMPRGSLEAWLHGYKQSKLSWHDRRKVAFSVTKALHYLHTQCNPPIIHRDIKASNILLTNYNQAKLTDFGLAVEASSTHSMCKDIMGTFGFADTLLRSISNLVEFPQRWISIL